MKKFFESFLAVLSAASIAASSSSFAFAAEEETGVIDLSGEIFSVSDCDNISFSLADFYPSVLSSSEGNFRLGDCLDANNKLVYEKLSSLVTPSLSGIKITFPEPVQFTNKTSVITGSEENFREAVMKSFSSGLAAVLFDMPEIFWVDQNGMNISPGQLSYKYDTSIKKYVFTLKDITLYPKAYEAFSGIDEINEYKEIFEKAVADFEVSGETRAEKLKSIHDQIAEFTYYDIEGGFSGSALSSLVTTASVCEGYSKGFKMICDREDIPCVCIFGNYNAEDSTAHMWNYVLMEDDCWYAVDLTWDDKDGANGQEFVDRYFLRGSDYFNRNHTEFQNYLTTHLEYPELATWDYGKNPENTTTTTMTTTTTSTTTTTTTTTTTSTTTTTTTTEPTTTSTTTTTTTTEPTTTSTTTTTTTTTTEPTTTSTTTTTTTTRPTTRPTTTTTTKQTTMTTEETTTTTTAEVVYEYGDINRDGKVSIADLVCCASFVLNAEPVEYCCDVDNDGRADVFDVIIMRRLIAEIIPRKLR